MGTLDIRLVYEAGATDPFDEGAIHSIRITVEGDEINTRKTTFDTVQPGESSGGKRSGRLGGLPVGKHVRVVVEGMDSNGTIGYRGVSSELELHRGSNQLYLFFSKIGAFSGPPTVQSAIAPDWRHRFRTVLRPGFGRAFHTATVLDDGTVLIAGGTQTPDPTDHLAFIGGGSALESAEIFDPTAGAFFKDSAFCVDVDEDGWGPNPDCLGFDCDDNNHDVQESCGPGCVDHDGDGYGVGDDCLGPDCKDTIEEGVDCAIGECCRACVPGNGLCMLQPRAFQSVVPLSDGVWLFIGGEPGGLSEQYSEYFIEEATDFQSATANPGIRRRQAAAQVGLDHVMVAGGEDGASELLRDIQVASTNTETLQFHTEGQMQEPRAGALGVAYPGGALIIGGWKTFSTTLPGERVPSTAIDRVKIDGDEVVVEHPSGLQLHLGRAQAAAVVYKTDAGYTRVLVCGGLIQNPDNGTLQPTQSCERIKAAQDGTDLVELLDGGHGLALPRWGHTMTLLPDGRRVLVAGGFTQTFSGAARNVAEIFDVQKVEKPFGLDATIPMRAKRGGHTATLMPNGMVLLVGGISAAGTMSSPGYEIYNP